MTQEGFALAKKFPGTKVKFGEPGKGVVVLGFARGSIMFRTDKKTGEMIWTDPGDHKNPKVSEVLIARAKAIYKEHMNNEQNR